MSFPPHPSSARPSPLPRGETRVRDQHRDTDSDGASPWLWATLMAVFIVAPSWWWARHGDEPFAWDTQPAPETSRQILPTTDSPRAMTMVAHQPVRAAVTSMEAKPLPGNAMPSYPPAIVHAGIQGSRTARLQLDAQGNVSDVTIIDRSGSDDARLDVAVIESLRRWRFAPATHDGHAVVSSVQVPVEFTAQR